MPGSFSDVAEGLILSSLFGGVAYSIPANWYIGFFSVAPTDSAAGTELSGSGYARKAVLNNTTQWPAVTAGQPIVNGVDITCFTASGSLGPAVAVGIFDALTSGNLIAWAWLGSDAGRGFTAATSDIFTCPGHSLVDTDAVRIVAIPGTTLPTGLVAGTTYYVRDMTGDTFKLAASSGGSAIDVTVSGSGLIAKITPIAIAADDVIRVLAGSLSISLD